ncbi:MAG: hypothetical protein IKO82_07035 [Prevotella sp.]|nr:hypothetical protein [Prevotella sp.]
MIIENPEMREEITHHEWGDETVNHMVIPKGLPGKHGATILMVGNMKYFLEMFTPEDTDYYLRPYEILAELEKQVMEDALNGEIEYTYAIEYKREGPGVEMGFIIFDFSHFEVNTETEPDENYRSLYIYFDYTCSAS